MGGTVILTQTEIVRLLRLEGDNQPSPSAISEQLGPRYYTYSESALIQARAEAKKVVLYFYAPWCTSCLDLEAELDSDPQIIPDDLIVLRVNYDKETALKKQYQVVTQHTFVLLDGNGQTLTTWVGGDAQDLIAKTRIELNS